MEHTKTPWVCHSGKIWKDGPTIYPKGNDLGIPIASMNQEPGNGTVPVERDENAKFIVRVVNSHEELLAFARTFVKRWKYQKKPTGDDLEIYLEEARTAIAKAEGK